MSLANKLATITAMALFIGGSAAWAAPASQTTQAGSSSQGQGQAHAKQASDTGPGAGSGTTPAKTASDTSPSSPKAKQASETSPSNAQNQPMRTASARQSLAGLLEGNASGAGTSSHAKGALHEVSALAGGLPVVSSATGLLGGHSVNGVMQTVSGLLGNGAGGTNLASHLMGQGHARLMGVASLSGVTHAVGNLKLGNGVDGTLGSALKSNINAAGLHLGGAAHVHTHVNVAGLHL